MVKYFFLWIIVLLFSNGYSQNFPGTKLKIKKFHGDIVLDEILDEQAWKDAYVADNWYQNFPVDSLPSPFQTEAHMIFNDEFLYVSFVLKITKMSLNKKPL